jgi:hypothetical protein
MHAGVLLDEMRARFAGRTVLVLGSAPSARRPSAYGSDWPLVCINASGRVGESLGLGKPALTIMASGALRRNLISNLEMRDNIRGLASDFVAVRTLGGGPVKRAWRGAMARRRLAALGFHYEGFAQLQPHVWQPVVTDVLGAEAARMAHNMSTGVFGCLLALSAGARHVVVAGIDPGSTGHAYSTSNQPRSHAAADRAVMEILVARGSLSCT